MRRLIKWSGYGISGLVVLALLAVTGVYVVSEYKLRRAHAIPPINLTIPGDSEAIKEGERLAQLRGCFRGCHAKLEGGIFFDEPWLARVVAPNLTEAAARYSAEELARIVRYGVRPDGTSTTGMPTEMFHFLSDEDLAKIIAFLKHAEPVESDLPKTRYRILARLALALGDFKVDAQRIEGFDLRPAALPARGTTPAYGEYLARTACTECHGLHLEGSPGGESPPLTIAKGYSRNDFERLMREGIALGERELGLMSNVAVVRFSQFTDLELDALHRFLQSAELPLAAWPAPGQAQ